MNIETLKDLLLDDMLTFGALFAIGINAIAILTIVVWWGGKALFFREFKRQLLDYIPEKGWQAGLRINALSIDSIFNVWFDRYKRVSRIMLLTLMLGVMLPILSIYAIAITKIDMPFLLLSMIIECGAACAVISLLLMTLSQMLLHVAHRFGQLKDERQRTATMDRQKTLQVLACLEQRLGKITRNNRWQEQISD